MVGALWLPAGVPALEVSYLLTAHRCAQGSPLYESIGESLDVLFVALYQWDEFHAPYVLRLWKVLGAFLLLTFFWKSRPSLPETPFSLLMASFVLIAYLLVPWRTSLQVGEPVLWGLLLLNRSGNRAFLRGVITGVGVGFYPVGLLAGVWTIYRRIEERAAEKAILWLGGVAWGGLAWSATLRLLGSFSSYVWHYWLSVWSVESGLSSLFRLLLYAGGLIGLFFLVQVYARQSYSERLRARDRLWAAIASLPLPSAAALWLALAVELRQRSLLTLITGAFYVGAMVSMGWEIIERSTCTIQLPPYSCVWGIPSCYVRVEKPYACDWTVPLRWKAEWSRPDWEQFYNRWGNPAYIWDFEGIWGEVRYFLPLLSAPYERKDTVLTPPLRVYYRR